MKNNERCLLVVSGPSGAGKDTVVAHMRAAHPEVDISVSATTRAMRPGEQDGVDYHYLTRAQFEDKIARGEMLEHTCYCGNCYGTPKSEIDDNIANGTSVVLVIEVQGAGNVKRLYPECTTVFIQPPSMEELERRLRGRGTESEQSIAGRLARAREEMALAPSYDYTLVNDDADACAERLYAILQARRA